MRTLALLLLAALAGPALAQTCTSSWTNPSGGVWEDPGNWDGFVPGPGSTACITLDGTYTVSQNSDDRVITGLVVGGASGTQTLTTSSQFGIGDGVIRPNGVLNVTNRPVSNDDGLYVAGTLTVEGRMTYTGSRLLFDGGVLDIAPGGSLHIAANVSAGSASALFRIRGTVEATCTTGCNVDAPVDVQGGTLRALVGRLNVRAGGTLTNATVDAVAGTTLWLLGTDGLVASGTLSGTPAGEVHVRSGTFAAAAGDATLDVGGVGLLLSSSVHLTSAGGAFRNTGLLVHAATVSNFVALNGVTLRNEGVMRQAYGLGFQNDALLVNEASGVIQIVNGGGLSGVGSDGSVRNAGLIVHSFEAGSGTRGEISVPYTGLPGSILRVGAGGRLTIDEGGSFEDVTFDVPAGAELFVSGGEPYELRGALSGTPAGLLYASNADFAAGAGGATLAIGGTGLQLSGSAFLTSAGGGFVNTGRLSTAATSSNSPGFRAVTVVNQGTVEFASFRLFEGAVLRNEAGATVLLTNGGLVSGDGRLENAGLILREGGTSSSRFGDLLFSLPGSEIRSNADRVDLDAPGAQTLPDGVTLTGTGVFGVGRDLDIQGTISPGTDAQPLVRLLFESAFIPSQTAGNARLVIDVDTDGRSDTLHVATTSGATNVILGGTLVARARPGYAPQVGDQFTVFTSARPITGAFAQVVAENADGAVFMAETAADQRSVVLTVTQSVAGEEAPGEVLAFAVGTQANPSATPSLRVTLPEAMALAVDVFDVQGRRVARLADDTRAAGTHAMPVSGLAPGVYVARVVAVGPTGTERATQRLVVVR